VLLLKATLKLNSLMKVKTFWKLESGKSDRVLLTFEVCFGFVQRRRRSLWRCPCARTKRTLELNQGKHLGLCWFATWLREPWCGHVTMNGAKIGGPLDLGIDGFGMHL
jgi:hypothetical protein